MTVGNIDRSTLATAGLTCPAADPLLFCCSCRSLRGNNGETAAEFRQKLDLFSTF